MPKRWRIHPHDADRIRVLERAAGVPPILAQLLLCRGLHDPSAARDFLEVKLAHLRDPAELPGVPAAVERLGAAVAQRRKITIYGDYDVDGITGASLLYQCLKLAGANVNYYLPHRFDEGYGLHAEALARLASQGTQTVVTVDCGIASPDEARVARELGIELIVTDHHEPGPELPPADVLVHPRLPGTAYPFGGLSGAGVAFKLAWAICQHASNAKRVSEPMKDFLLSALGLAALGTVADVAPLLDENRVMVHYGMASLKERAGLGMQALMKLTDLHGKSRLEAEDIAFKLAPRLNAAGRLGQGPLAVELLTTSSAERAQALAEYIHELNASRQSLERSIMLAANKQAKEQFDLERDAALVLADRDWHQGVIGIVAGRLAEKYHRPVVLISLDGLGAKPGVGSARSVAGFNVHEALARCSSRLVKFGGHAAAAGLKVQEADIDAFRHEFCELAAEGIPTDQRVAQLWIDAETPLASLTREVVGQIERMAPFGAANPRPLLCATGIVLAEPPKRMGEGGRHLSLKVRQHQTQFRAVAFGEGDWADELPPPNTPLSVAFRPVINEYNGRRSVELQLADWQPADATTEPRPLAAGGLAG